MVQTSIIIITYNGASKISRLLLSIDKLLCRNFEVIIIIDGSTDHTEKIIEGLTLHFNFQVIVQQNAGRAAAKNKGASLSKYDLLWFIDDDMRMVPEALDAHLKQIKNHPNTISVGTQLEEEILNATDIQLYKRSISNGWKKQIESATNPLTVKDLYITSANVFMPRQVFNTLGRFDERLRDAEDLDLAYLAYLKHIPVYYNALAIGYHLDLITCRSYIQRNRQYLAGYKILRNLKPHYLEINNRMQTINLSKLKKQILSIICQPVFINLIDHYTILKFVLPRSIRFRFYELLIFGLGRVFTDKTI